jgi:GT2 family glycosyltransferase
MNPVLLLTHNNIELTKRCVESVFSQDIETHLVTIDNGSSDGTLEWLGQNRPFSVLIPEGHNRGVSAGWNTGLELMLGMSKHDHCLVINNDIILAPWFYRELLSYEVPFVTGIGVDHLDQLPVRPCRAPLQPHPHFSAFLIRRECWEKVGPFDERMKLYSSDQDYHIRAHRVGVALMAACVPFYHEPSSTLRLASPEEQREIQEQANKDRAALKEKWGVSAGGPDYEALFKPELFGIDRS